MEAVKFFKTMHRLCDEYNDGNCEACPMHKYCASDENMDAEAVMGNEEAIVAIVEEWEREHPLKTRQEKLLRALPELETKVDNKGRLQLCPGRITGNSLCAKYPDCTTCLEEFWLTGVE